MIPTAVPLYPGSSERQWIHPQCWRSSARGLPWTWTGTWLQPGASGWDPQWRPRWGSSQLSSGPPCKVDNPWPAEAPGSATSGEDYCRVKDPREDAAVGAQVLEDGDGIKGWLGVTLCWLDGLGVDGECVERPTCDLDPYTSDHRRPFCVHHLPQGLHDHPLIPNPPPSFWVDSYSEWDLPFDFTLALLSGTLTLFVS